MKMINYALVFVCITIPFCLVMDVKVQQIKRLAMEQMREELMVENQLEEMQHYGE
jgi:hypothetical protein